MGYIINLGSMFFLFLLVLNLAYIDCSLCQIWSVYMQYLRCCDPSNKRSFPVIQQAEVLLNFFGECMSLPLVPKYIPGCNIIQKALLAMCHNEVFIWRNFSVWRSVWYTGLIRDKSLYHFWQTYHQCFVVKVKDVSHLKNGSLWDARTVSTSKMTSWHGNTHCITGLLRGEFTAHRLIEKYIFSKE